MIQIQIFNDLCFAIQIQISLIPTHFLVAHSSAEEGLLVIRNRKQIHTEAYCVHKKLAIFFFLSSPAPFLVRIQNI